MISKIRKRCVQPLIVSLIFLNIFRSQDKNRGGGNKFANGFAFEQHYRMAFESPHQATKDKDPVSKPLISIPHPSLTSHSIHFERLVTEFKTKIKSFTSYSLETGYLE